jgi:selT/selW/selH-like putative selenoprotein
LEADLKKQFPDSNITLISSGGGVFEVTLDSELIFSKNSLERFPNPGEVEGLIQDKQ